MEYLQVFRDIVIAGLDKRKWSRKELARRINMDQTLINGMLRGERRFNEDQVAAIAAAFGVEPYKLFMREDPAVQTAGTLFQGGLQNTGDDIYRKLAVLAPSACIKHEANQQDFRNGYRAFEKKFLAGFFKPFLTRVWDESMFPMLSEGDLALFDRNPDKLKDPDPNKIYMVNLAATETEANITLKQVLFSGMERVLTLIPANRKYKIKKYEMNENKSLNDYVAGVAVWIGKELEAL
ncbi:MAG: helix-turn-helix domain-containing protein [bacterium]|nr:helix-turn-helix domain-containing protein [bacterium]